MPAPRPISVMHVVDLPGPNAWLNGLVDHTDRTRYRHLATSTNVRNSFNSALEERGITTYALGNPTLRHLPRTATALARLLIEENIDIVQTHTVGPASIGLAAAALVRLADLGRSRLPGRPARRLASIVTRHHADFTTIFHKPLHRQLDRAHALLADRVWSPSQFIRDCMQRYEQVAPERVTILPHAFDFAGLRPTLGSEERRTLRDEVGGDGQTLIGSVGRLSIEKGHDTLLEAAAPVLAARPDARFVIVGDGPRRALLEQRARQLGLADRLRFLGWRFDSWKLIEAMDLIVHPCAHEGFGIVFVEAMALERALVAVRGGAAPEIIDDGETGVLVPPGDAPAMAAAVLSLLADPARREHLGKEGHRRVHQRYDFRHMLKEYEAFYDQTHAQFCRVGG